MSKENYFMIDGKRIPISDETAKEIIAIKENKITTYKDVGDNLFRNKKSCFINNNSTIIYTMNTRTNIYDSNNSVTKEQLEAILALNKLANVAKYLNGEWLPYWNYNNSKYSIIYNYDEKDLDIIIHSFTQASSVYFKTKELARKAIDILGKEEIIKALTLNH